MSISTNFPAIKPSLMLDFANTGSLDPRVTFSRASTATYYDGVTTAKAEQNLVTYSGQMYNGAGWGGAANITTTDAGAASAPDGVDSAALITSTSSTNQHYLQKSGVLYYAVAGETYTFSVFLKAGTNSIIQVAAGNTTEMGSQAYLNVNLSSGTLGTYGTNVLSPNIVAIGGAGWYRVSFSSVAATTGANGNFLLSFTAENSSAGRLPSITNAGTETFYAWGAQVEKRLPAAVTSYTATTTQPITNYIPVLQTAAANVARFDHNPTTGESLGLLIEEQRTNLLTYSSEFDNAAWQKTRASITADTIVAPDGTLTGGKLVIDTTAAANHSIGQVYSFTSGTTYTLTVYAKASEISQINLRFSSQFPAGNTGFDLSAGTVTNYGTVTASAITPIGNDWYRCSFTQTASSSGTAQAQIFLSVAGIITIPTANGFDGVFLWGAQLEAGAFPTSYIGTTSAATTRSADAALMTGTNFSSWYNQGEGALYTEAQGQGGTYISIDNGTTSERNVLYFATSTQPRYFVSAGGATSCDITAGSIVANSYNKIVGAYSANDFGVCLNGAAVVSDTSGAVAAPIEMKLGRNVANTGYLNGHIRKLAYYPQRLSDANLQALTS